MSVLPNYLSSAGYPSQGTLLKQGYLDQTNASTSRSIHTDTAPGICFISIINSMSSVHKSDNDEDDLSPYEFARSSGALSFWDDPKEDIYTLQDGQPL